MPATVPEFGMVTLLDNMLTAYLQQYPAGGTLTNILIEANWDYSSVKYCQALAQQQHDYIGATLATALLQMPRVIMLECNGAGLAAGLQLWRDLIQAYHASTTQKESS